LGSGRLLFFSSSREGKNWKQGLGRLQLIFGIDLKQKKNLLFGGIKLLIKTTRIHPQKKNLLKFYRKERTTICTNTLKGIRVCYFYGLLYESRWKTQQRGAKHSIPLSRPNVPKSAHFFLYMLKLAIFSIEQQCVLYVFASNYIETN